MRTKSGNIASKFAAPFSFEMKKEERKQSASFLFR